MIGKALGMALKGIYELFCAIFEEDSEVEIAKDKEINYERNQWGYWK